MNFIDFRNTPKTPPKLKNHETSENVEPNEMHKNEHEKKDRNRRARATASKNMKNSIVPFVFFWALLYSIPDIGIDAAIAIPAGIGIATGAVGHHFPLFGSRGGSSASSMSSQGFQKLCQVAPKPGTIERPRRIIGDCFPKHVPFLSNI